MSKFGHTIVVSAIALGALGVRTYVGRQSQVGTGTPSSTLSPAAALAHLDHTPRHGGLVLMNGDTHFEVVLERDGRCSVYFSDAVRAALPASVASQVGIAMTPAGHSPDLTPLGIDATGAFWIGRGRRIGDPNAVVRIAYTAEDKPYWIDVPVSAWAGLISSLP